jgi:hypothetical protein
MFVGQITRQTMKTQNHTHISLDVETMNFPKDLVISQWDLVILHNLCVDVLNDYPEMMSIESIKEKLQHIINLPTVPDEGISDFEMDEDQ